jgi:type IV pilus assembly protein PilY1
LVKKWHVICLKTMFVAIYIMVIIKKEIFSVKKNRGKYRMKKINKLLKSLTALIILLLPSSLYAAAMNDYCITPPFVVAGVNPNLLLMLDNSASQYDLEYTDSSPTATFCYDASYDNTGNYAGYFDSDKIYTSTGVPYTTDITIGNTTFSSFTETPSLPASCTYKTSYLCINITSSTQTVKNPGACKKTPPQGTCTYADCSCFSDTDCQGSGNSCQGVTTSTTTVYDVSDFTASGKFLNWLSASKFDVQKQILTGGKYDTANQLLVSEGRGCVGSRYVKEVPLADWVPAQATSPISFGVRGDVSSDVRLPSTGGITRIDIFKGDFGNSSSCVDAINCWATCGNTCGGSGCGSCKSDTNTCFDLSNTGGDSATWNHALQTCWTCAHQPCCPEDIGTGDISRIWTTNECGDTNIDYTGLSPSQPRYVCLNDVSGSTPDSGTFAGCSMNDYAGDVGLPGKYIGICNGLSGAQLDNCTKYQFAYFCRGMQVGQVVDPTSGATNTSCAGNIPANFMDGGLSAALGRPIRTLHARINDSVPEGLCSVTTAKKCNDNAECPSGEKCYPSGLIQQFQNQIRFGAMTFRTYGSRTECTTPDSMIIYTCTDPSNLDAGKVISYIGAGYCSVTSSQACIANSDCPAGENCVPSVGDHTSGLINTIDLIQAATWTPFSEAFYDATGYFAQRTDLRINSASGNEDFLVDTSHNPIQYRCQKNSILLVTDGMSTADLNPSVTSLVSGGSCGGSCNFTGQIDTTVNANIKYAGSRNVADVSYIARHRNINNFGTTPVNASDSITTHVVYTGMGTTYSSNLLDPYSLMYATANNGGGTFQNPTHPEDLKNALQEAFQTIAASSSSGTAASVLASGEGSGANLIQALFYPIHSIGGTQITWTGSLQNFWYYIDPLLGNSSIREDSTNDWTLNLTNDYIMHFRFPNSVTDQNTVADLFADSDGDGVADSSTPINSKYLDEYIDPSNKLKYLWEAGKLLWARSPLTRNIYTYDGTNMITIPQTTTPINSAPSLVSLLSSTGNLNEANAIMRYVQGTDVKVCDDTTHTGSKTDCTTNPSVCAGGETCTAYRSRTVNIGGTSNPWKLGDIVTSTPKIGSWIPLGSYHKTYGDTTYGPLGYDPQLTDPVDTTKFIATAGYKDRGMVFVGANDGMLHAFKLGTIELLNGKYDKAKLCDSRSSCSTTTLGKEEWAYIPKHVLPYLQYMADPNYCHLYYVDLVPTIVDASIGPNDTGSPTDTKNSSSWRTILIGGTRYGGACNDSSTSYDVQTPLSGEGYSSYFALDITDTLAHPDDSSVHPEVLWEFSNETIKNSSYSGDLTPGPTWIGGLGFATSGPAIVRVGAAKDSSGNPLNGRWFAVFGSGPTGPIDSASHQFKGYSDQPLKIYVVDLRGPSYGFWRFNTGIPNAFSGSLIGSPIDLDQNNPAATGYYQDDALYFGYTKAENNPVTSGTRWTRGGVMRVVTKESTDPGTWVWGELMDNNAVGPITAAVAKLQNYKPGSEALWLYFGTGRYFYKIGSQIDDANSRRAIRGVSDPCFNHDTVNYHLKLDPACVSSSTVTSPSVTDAQLGNVTDYSANATSRGWMIALDNATSVYDAERMTTDPVATGVGAVFFTTIEPSADVCEFGGATHLWAVDYATGGAVKKGVLRGKALIQVSTGSISEQDLSSAFTQGQDQSASAASTVVYRKTAGTQGLASSEKPQIAVPPKPINKILHMRER